MVREKTAGDTATSHAAAGDGETLEAFVARLHDEGVEAGRQEADRVLRDARKEATEIVERARSEADSLVAAAKERVAEEEGRGRAELELAARDVVLELRAALKATLSAILERGVSQRLSDAAVMEKLLREVVSAYARNDADRRPREIRVPRALADEVEGWWRAELSEMLRGEASIRVDPLLEAGFEYQVSGGTVEVSVDATVAKLMELLRPRLREILLDGTRVDRDPAGEAALAGSGLGDRGG